MRGFAPGSARYANLLAYLNSVISDESIDQAFRFQAACRLADTLIADDARDARHELARERAAARKIEASCRAAEAANQSRLIALQEQAAYVEPLEPIDPEAKELFSNILNK